MSIKVPSAKLEELRRLANEHALAQLEAQAAGQAFDSAVGRALMEAGGVIGRNALCLACGKLGPQNFTCDCGAA